MNAYVLTPTPLSQSLFSHHLIYIKAKLAWPVQKNMQAPTLYNFISNIITCINDSTCLQLGFYPYVI